MSGCPVFTSCPPLLTITRSPSFSSLPVVTSTNTPLGKSTCPPAVKIGADASPSADSNVSSAVKVSAP